MTLTVKDLEGIKDLYIKSVEKLFTLKGFVKQVNDYFYTDCTDKNKDVLFYIIKNKNSILFSTRNFEEKQNKYYAYQYLKNINKLDEVLNVKEEEQKKIDFLKLIKKDKTVKKKPIKNFNEETILKSFNEETIKSLIKDLKDNLKLYDLEVDDFLQENTIPIESMYEYTIKTFSYEQITKHILDAIMFFHFIEKHKFLLFSPAEEEEDRPKLLEANKEKIEKIFEGEEEELFNCYYYNGNWNKSIETTLNKLYDLLDSKKIKFKRVKFFQDLNNQNSSEKELNKVNSSKQTNYLLKIILAIMVLLFIIISIIIYNENLFIIVNGNQELEITKNNDQLAPEV